MDLSDYLFDTLRTDGEFVPFLGPHPKGEVAVVTGCNPYQTLLPNEGIQGWTSARRN